MSPEAFPKGFHVRKTIAFALVLALLLPIAVFWGWLVLSPKPPLLDGVPFSPLVLDRDGNLLRLGLSEDEKYRVRIRLNEVAPEMVRAVLLYEDRHFYRHPGVNPLSLLRASAGMLGGARRMGGSTITMQVAGSGSACPQPRFRASLRRWPAPFNMNTIMARGKSLRRISTSRLMAAISKASARRRAFISALPPDALPGPKALPLPSCRRIRSGALR